MLALTFAAIAAEAATIDQLAAVLGVLTAKEVVEAPDIVGPGLDGKTIRLEGFRGKAVFLNFWATWCIPCRQEMPAMERLYQEYKERGFVVLAVNVMEGLGAVKAFVQELKLTFPVVLDPDGKASMAYLVRGLPATYLIDRNQILVGRAIGAREWDGKDARAYIQALLKKGP